MSKKDDGSDYIPFLDFPRIAKEILRVTTSTSTRVKTPEPEALTAKKLQETLDEVAKDAFLHGTAPRHIYKAQTYSTIPSRAVAVRFEEGGQWHDVNDPPQLFDPPFAILFESGWVWDSRAGWRAAASAEYWKST